MKVLFLDFDGVLNSQEAYDRAGGRGAWELYSEHIRVLNDILGRSPELLIVISSSWRLDRSNAELQGDLAEKGAAVDGRILDATPRIFSSRGEEIAQWLETHPEIAEWVILDDESHELTVEQLSRAVITDARWGLRPEHALAVLELLGDLSISCS